MTSYKEQAERMLMVTQIRVNECLSLLKEIEDESEQKIINKELANLKIFRTALLDMLRGCPISLSEWRGEAMTFKVEQSGWYRTRDGRLAEVVVSEFKGKHPVIGYIAGGDGEARAWSLDGVWRLTIDSPEDLIEYLGKERPKKHKRNLSLWSCGQVTSAGWIGLLPHDSFVVETREIEWEVPDNG